MRRSLVSLAFGLGLLFPARAHVPHDPTTFVASPPDPASPLLIVGVGREETWLLARTGDDLSFAYRFALDAHEALLTSGALLSTRRLLLGTRARTSVLEGQGLLLSEDAGDALSVHADIPEDASILDILPSPTVSEDGLVFVAGSSGIHVSRDGGDSFRVCLDDLDEVVVDLDLAPEGADTPRVCGVTAGGRLFCSEDLGDAWEEIPTPVSAARAISVGEGRRLWLGAREPRGLFVTEDLGGEWRSGGFEDEPVSAVEDLGGGLVLATLTDEGVHRSEDAGRTWTLADTGIEAVEAGQSLDGNHFFAIRRAADGSILVASFEGPYRSRDEGRSWEALQTEGPWNVRAVSLLYDEDDALTAFLGSYGAGPSLVDVGLRSARSLAGALPHRHTRAMAATARWGPGQAWYGAAGDLFLAADGEEAWEGVLGSAMGEFHRFAVSPDPGGAGLLLAAGEDPGGEGRLLRSEDGGRTWEIGLLDAPCPDTFFAVDVSRSYATDGLAWSACDAGGLVFESRDAGRTWQNLAALDAWVFGLAGAEGLLLAATADGLFRILEGGPAQRVAFDGRLVFGVALSPAWPEDPTAFALVLGEGWFRSEDGGLSWDALPIPTEDPPRALSLSPGFGEDGTLAVAGQNGAWVSEDRGETWRPIHAILRLEEQDPAWRLGEGWSLAPDLAASGRSVARNDAPGSSLRLRFRGVALDLHARPGPGALWISVDGAPGELRSLRHLQEGEPAFSLRGLPDRFHEILLIGVEGGEAVDMATVWLLPVDALADDGKIPIQGGGICGCAAWADPASPVPGHLFPLLLPPLLLSRRVRGRRGLGGRERSGGDRGPPERDRQASPTSEERRWRC